MAGSDEFILMRATDPLTRLARRSGRPLKAVDDQRSPSATWVEVDGA
jgi:hypothetical protein